MASVPAYLQVLSLDGNVNGQRYSITLPDGGPKIWSPAITAVRLRAELAAHKAAEKERKRAAQAAEKERREAEKAAEKARKEAEKAAEKERRETEKTRKVAESK
jgi:hypothetical protein